jgi:hypothetical protein
MRLALLFFEWVNCPTALLTEGHRVENGTRAKTHVMGDPLPAASPDH